MRTLREAYHPSVAFIYGWTLLLVTQTGGMAAVAVTFARYFLEVTHLEIADGIIAILVLGVSDGNQLSGGARRKHRSKRADDHEDRRYCRPSWFVESSL
jgi:hypothetical protein